MTDQSGQVVSRHDYRGFGEEVASSYASRTATTGYGTTDGIRTQFTGYEKDTESGLDYAQARYYNSKHGRFTSADPLTASATIRNPQTFNRYRYVTNSPYKFTDPLGLFGICPGGGQGGQGGMPLGNYSWRAPTAQTPVQPPQTPGSNFVYDTDGATTGTPMSAAQRGALENAIATLRSQSPIADANFAVFDRNPDSGSTLTIAVMADANFEKMSGITKTAQAVTDANGQHLGKDGTLYQDAIVVIRESAIQPFTKTRYYSANKQYFVEVTKNGRAALYRARRRRPSQLVWIRKLKILPAKLIVTSDGRRVATIDRYYGNGGNPTMPAVILLNEEGYEIASYALSEVANLARVIQTTSSAQWYGTATLSADEKELVINTEVSKRDRATCDHIRSSEHTYECARSVPYEELHFSMITGGMTRMRV